MRERLRICIAYCLYYSGLLKLALWLRQRSGGRLIILNYHHATGHLAAQLRYLQRHYRIMHLEDALAEFYTAPAKTATHKEKQGRDRRIPLVLTFDDGYIDNYNYAFPLIRSLHIPITLFIIPGYAESGKCFWWLAPTELVQSATVEKVSVEGKTYVLSRSEDRAALVDVIDRLIRYAPSVAVREQTLADLQKALGVTLSSRDAEGQNNDALPITWEQIREMEASGLVSIGAHTMHHPLLSSLTDVSEVQYEVAESRRVLEQQLGHPVHTFAYPIGKPSHFGDQGVEAVKMAGFKWAVTTLEEQNTSQTDPYLLARLPGNIKVHWMVMAAELVGMLGVMSRIRKRYARLLKR
jgi:peptidoglycan/xylan/chitin deacetylase (PgdA/CDA1 family)